MRYVLILAVLVSAVLGCARDVGVPTLPDPSQNLQAQTPYEQYDGPYRLWGEWLFYIDESHEKIDVVPARNGRLHLNSLKFLEENIANCLQITDIHNNGDETIDLTVKITHPFLGLSQFTGFDVKGIIMFNGSYEFADHSFWKLPIPDPCFISWREFGDPEVINPDGYTYRWSPVYESGSDLPIFNYREGKFSNGVPNAGINAYLNFYTDEDRHMFRSNNQVTRTYKIWLPPGQPVVAGYAVEACWEPPTVTPVTNPAEDFPVTANQTEPYHFDVIMNNGEPIIKGSDCCGYGPNPCTDLRLVSKEWDDKYNTHISWWTPPDCGSTWMIVPCDEYEDSWDIDYFSTTSYEPGRYRDVCVGFEGTMSGDKLNIVFDLIDFTIIE